MENEKKDIFDKLMELPLLRIFNPFYKKYKEVLMYLFFGVLATVVSIATFAVFNVGCGMNALIANVLSWIITVIFAYVTNRTWVFASNAHTFGEVMKEMAGFFGGRLFTLGVEELMIFVFITKLGFDAMLIKIIAQFVIVVLNYVISKLIVFKDK